MKSLLLLWQLISKQRIQKVHLELEYIWYLLIFITTVILCMKPFDSWSMTKQLKDNGTCCPNRWITWREEVLQVEIINMDSVVELEMIMYGPEGDVAVRTQPMWYLIIYYNIINTSSWENRRTESFMLFSGLMWEYFIASVHIISHIREDNQHEKGIGHYETIYEFPMWLATCIENWNLQLNYLNDVNLLSIQKEDPASIPDSHNRIWKEFSSLPKQPSSQFTCRRQVKLRHSE